MNSFITYDPILEVRNLHLTYQLRSYRERTLREVFVNLARNPVNTIFNPRNEIHVLRGLSFSLKKGDRVALMGFNGSGKTSLCRAVSGILRPQLGTVLLRGECRSLFGTPVGFHPNLTGRENAKLMCRLYFPKESPTSLSDLVNESLEFSELGHFVDAPYETYSQGMKSRLGLSLATAKPHDLLIMDEVYDQADAYFRAKMAARMDRFINLSGAVIFVSHLPEFIRQTCNQGILLHQ